MVQQAEERFGGVDVLVNNAGYGYRAAVEEGEDSEVRTLFDTHFFGTVAMIKAVLPGMRARHRGAIVNISSIGVQLTPVGSGYDSAAKAAIEGLSGALRGELAPLGISVTVVEPGAFRTDFAGRSLVQSPKVIDDDAATAGQRRKENDTMHGNQAGDPAKGAAAIIAAVEEVSDPPSFLLPGPTRWPPTATLRAGARPRSTPGTAHHQHQLRTLAQRSTVIVAYLADPSSAAALAGRNRGLAHLAGRGCHPAGCWNPKAFSWRRANRAPVGYPPAYQPGYPPPGYPPGDQSPGQPGYPPYPPAGGYQMPPPPPRPSRPAPGSSSPASSRCLVYGHRRLDARGRSPRGLWPDDRRLLHQRGGKLTYPTGAPTVAPTRMRYSNTPPTPTRAETVRTASKPAAPTCRCHAKVSEGMFRAQHARGPVLRLGTRRQVAAPCGLRRTPHHQGRQTSRRQHRQVRLPQTHARRHLHTARQTLLHRALRNESQLTNRRRMASLFRRRLFSVGRETNYDRS